MIYLLSDTHGGECSDALFDYIDKASENDLLIVLGDLGISFTDTSENQEFDRKLFESTKKIAFIDGNHENFKYIYSFPEEEWCGGVVHRLAESIIHLERGYIYEIEGMRFFTFGGCKSSAKWKELGLWHPEEMPTHSELSRAYDTLAKADNKVDYILTHKYERIGGEMTEGIFELCSYIDNNVEFSHWYSGHWHCERRLDEKHSVIYDVLTPIKNL